MWLRRRPVQSLGAKLARWLRRRPVQSLGAKLALAAGAMCLEDSQQVCVVKGKLHLNPRCEK